MRDCVTNAFREGALERILVSRPMIALYTGMAKGDETTTQYSNSNEVRGTGYTPGGVKLEGGASVSAGGYVKVASVYAGVSSGFAAAKGIKNPTDEELLLILRRVRSIRHT